jgi:hypothetical protein
MFHVRSNDVLIGYSGSIEGAREIVRCEPPGCYDVDEIRADRLFRSGITPRRWGSLIMHPDGQVEEAPHPLP